MDENIVDDYRPANFALGDRSIEARVAMIDDFMADLDEKARDNLAAFPVLLGLALETSVSFRLSPNAAVKVAGNLTRYLQARCLERLSAIVNEALLARLPSYR